MGRGQYSYTPFRSLGASGEEVHEAYAPPPPPPDSAKRCPPSWLKPEKVPGLAIRAACAVVACCALLGALPREAPPSRSRPAGAEAGAATAQLLFGSGRKGLFPVQEAAPRSVLEVVSAGVDGLTCPPGYFFCPVCGNGLSDMCDKDQDCFCDQETCLGQPGLGQGGCVHPAQMEAGRCPNSFFFCKQCGNGKHDMCDKDPDCFCDDHCFGAGGVEIAAGCVRAADPEVAPPVSLAISVANLTSDSQSTSTTTTQQAITSTVATGTKQGATTTTTTRTATTTSSTRTSTDAAWCDTEEEDVVYWTGPSLQEEADAPALQRPSSAAECRSSCKALGSCGSWSWGRHDGGGAASCLLRGWRPSLAPERREAPGFVSGLSCYAARKWQEHHEVSLFCFSLMIPTGYEPALIKAQFEEGASIFDCDAYQVYSSRIVVIAAGLETVAVDSDLKCEYGGEFHTALNLEIFVAVWIKVVEQRTFLRHDWTVKVDPDCVFFPRRLRLALQAYEPGPNGVYVNNCKFGLHGPFEAFSQAAVQAWAQGFQKCKLRFQNGCDGQPCVWGEDIFIDQCLWKVLKVKRIDDYSLLVEDHCAPPIGWQSCQDRRPAAFHPFKTVAGYRDCLHNSSSQALIEAVGALMASSLNASGLFVA